MNMHTVGQQDVNLPPSTDTGSLGIPHLKRCWYKILSGANNAGQFATENETDAALLDVLQLGLLPTYQFLYQQQPSFEVFEQWVVQHHPDGISPDIIQQCYRILGTDIVTAHSSEENSLTETDLAFWEEQGYVIVRNAISAADCAASREAIWQYLQMNEQDPATWYNTDNDLQGIMAPLYHHAVLDKNRHSFRIRRAFEQLWNESGLIVTTDKCGFNPPETAHSKYKGIGLHWDMSLATPIPFGTQGILYLTDTAANQGALTVVPGFHKTIEKWLASLPENVNPRDTDFSVFHPQPIAANAGDLIIWNQLLPHSSSPNTATLPRLVQYINWYSPLQKKQAVWR
jgi:ectoine hydroxylase-related dioxygenase (phytanoyl-CoA dioxygenase family)